MQTLTYVYNIEGHDYTAVVTWVSDNNPPNIKFIKHVEGQRVDDCRTQKIKMIMF